MTRASILWQQVTEQITQIPLSDSRPEGVVIVGSGAYYVLVCDDVLRRTESQEKRREEKRREEKRREENREESAGACDF